MPILSEKLIEEMDQAKQCLDESKLEIFVDDMFSNLIRETIFYASIQDEDNEERKDEVVKNFRKAWNYGKKIYAGDFTQILLTEIAGRVEPTQATPAGYAELRKHMTNIPGIQYTPPADRLRIEQHLDRLYKALKKPLHPVEEALCIYYHLTRIQPFDGGNKRTANIIMNLTLDYHQFPTIHIKPEERNTYGSLLKGALREFQEEYSEDPLRACTNPGFQQRGLYDFLALKVRDNLIAAKDHLKNLDKYEITFKTKYRGIVYTTKKKVASWFEKRKATYQARVMSKENKLLVVGEIDYEVLDNILSEFRSLSSYSIKQKK